MLRFTEWDRKTWRLVIPIVLTNITVPILGIVDTAVIGHLPGAHYLGAIAVGTLVFSVLYASMLFLRMGTTGLTSQSVGAKDHAEVRAWLMRGLILSVLIGVILILLQVPIGMAVLGLTGASDAVLNLAADYFYIRIWSAPFTLINFVVLGWFIGVQNTRPALITQVVLNSINIVLDIWFVVGLDLGVSGVAYATVIAEGIGALLGLFLVQQQARHLKERWHIGRALDRLKLIQMLRINGDIFIRSVCLQVAIFVFTSHSARDGDVTLAANTLLLKFTIFTAYALDGFANAAEALVGKAYGANSRADFRAAAYVSSRWAFIFATLFTCLFWVAGTHMIDALTTVEPVRDISRVYLPWLIASPLVAVWSFQLDGIFVGATKTSAMRNAMIMSTLGYLLAVYLLTPLLGNHGLWLSLMLFFALRALTLGVYYPHLEKGLAST